MLPELELDISQMIQEKVIKKSSKVTMKSGILSAYSWRYLLRYEFNCLVTRNESLKVSQIQNSC